MTAIDPRMNHLRELLDKHRNEVSDAYHNAAAIPAEVEPGDGKWKVREVLEHLANTERSLTGLLAKLGSGAPAREAGDSFNEAEFLKTLDMPFFLDRTNKLKGQQPEGNLSAEEAWQAMSGTRDKLLEVINQFQGKRLEEVHYEHPVTHEELNGYQWIAFLALHESRHAAQIREIAGN